MKGRKPKPKTMKIIQGTFRDDRDNPAAPDPSQEAMRAPAYLPREAVEYFGILRAKIEEYGLASSSFSDALGLAAMRLAEIDQLNQIINADGGPVYESTRYTRDEDTGKMNVTVMKKTHPASTQRSEAMRHLQSLLAEFGLTPASIAKVSSPRKTNQAPAWGVNQ